MLLLSNQSQAEKPQKNAGTIWEETIRTRDFPKEVMCYDQDCMEYFKKIN
jgi:hypothetical protein